MTEQTFPHPYSVSVGTITTAVIAITETCDSSHHSEHSFELWTVGPHVGAPAARRLS